MDSGFNILKVGHYWEWDKMTEEQKEEAEYTVKEMLKLHADTRYYDDWVE